LVLKFFLENISLMVSGMETWGLTSAMPNSVRLGATGADSTRAAGEAPPPETVAVTSSEAGGLAGVLTQTVNGTRRPGKNRSRL
jgi:hypothetical protein